MHDVAGSELRNKVQFVWANQEDDAEVSMGFIGWSLFALTKKTLHPCSLMKLG
jgi:hypothetical protein